METVILILVIVLGLTALFLGVCYMSFRMAFYSTEKEKAPKEDDMPPGKIYEPYYEQMRAWNREIANFNSEEVSITSYDGLTLRGTYTEHFPGAPVEIMFHGYRGNAKRDLCGALQRCYALKRNVLAVNHRAHANSDGNIITFGIKERYDVKAWAEYAYARFGDGVPLIITGISMGATSVLMASSLEMPKTVVGVIADCGFSSAKDVIKLVIKETKLPASICYPFVKLGAIIFGKFNPESTSAEEEVKRSRLPILLIHGDEDERVPCAMSEKIKSNCASACELAVFSGAGHGASFLVDQDKYIKVVQKFEEKFNMIG